MKINVNYYDNQKDFITNIKNFNQRYFLFIASNTNISLEEFNSNNINITGARFPHIIYNGKLFEEGIIALEISVDMNIHFIENIKNYDFNNDICLSCKSIMTILDGFSEYNETFLSKLFENVDINTNIIGGGAGLLENDTDSVLFDNKGFYRNSAVLITLKSNMNMGAKHGWEYLEGPFIATDCEKNNLKTIDYVSAFEHYKNVIKKDCGIELTKDNFLEVSQNYPIGIIKYQGEQIVRDPMSFKDGSLQLLGEISNNSMINILKGDMQSLLKSSKQASIDANSKNSDFLILFNCISRKIFLGENFEKELNQVYDKSSNIQMVGATTLGEIANSGNKYINFLNKTCVIGGVCN